MIIDHYTQDNKWQSWYGRLAVNKKASFGRILIQAAPVRSKNSIPVSIKILEEQSENEYKYSRATPSQSFPATKKCAQMLKKRVELTSVISRNALLKRKSFAT